MSECKRYKDVKNIMDKLVYNVIYDKKLTEPSIAFTLQRQGLLGEIYKIYVNDSNKDLAEKLFMHEAGHVIFGHVNNQEIQTKIVSDRIRITFEKYKDRMPQEEGFFDYMRNYIFNIAMDFEDRKSTRLNSSHQIISYAVFCLKKKNKVVSKGESKHKGTIRTKEMATQRT